MPVKLSKQQQESVDNIHKQVEALVTDIVEEAKLGDVKSAKQKIEVLAALYKALRNEHKD